MILPEALYRNLLTLVTKKTSDLFPLIAGNRRYFGPDYTPSVIASQPTAVLASLPSVLVRP